MFTFKFQRVALVVVTQLLTFSFPCRSSEIDSFTERYGNRNDASKQINAYTQILIKNALIRANQSQGCDKNRLLKALESHLKGGFVAGTVEAWVNEGGEGTVDITRLPRSKSIFKYVPLYENVPMYLSTHTIASLINIQVGKQTHYIGSDKLGHFLTEGNEYYHKAFIENKGVQAALDWGWGTELGIFGLMTSGVFSYADLVANYNGMVFWANLFQQYAHGKGPYFACQNNMWAQVQAFDWRHYIDQSWDEGVNCSHFRDSTYTKAIQKRQDELHQEKGWDYRCPAEPRKCIGIGAQYGDLKRQLIHPRCLEITSMKKVYQFLLEN